MLKDETAYLFIFISILYPDYSKVIGISEMHDVADICMFKMP